MGNIELWKLVAHGSGNTSIRIYEAKLCKTVYKLIGINHQIKLESLMNPKTSMNDEHLHGYVFCLPEKYEEAKKILHDWMISRANKRVQLLKSEIIELERYLKNPPDFTNPKIVRVEDE